MVPNRLLRQRLRDEVVLLGLYLGEVNVDEAAHSWIMVPRVPIPRQLGRASCAVLIVIPPAYPHVPPHGVYIDGDLDLPLHYFQGPHDDDFAIQGWAWLCLHPPGAGASSWRPSRITTDGDNLITIMLLIQAMLTDLASDPSLWRPAR